MSAGMPNTAVAVAMKHALTRTAKSPLLKLNQAEGFDCMSCAWPDPASPNGTSVRRMVVGPLAEPDQCVWHTKRAI